MEFTFQTDVGKVRAHNEDSGGVFENKFGILAVVADGMGGHRAGDVASAMATDYLRDLWAKEQEIISVKEAEKWLVEQFELLNKKLYTHAKNHEECYGMGTTLVVALCTKEFISIAHIGDSRAYLFNEFGFQQKTNDHSLVQELVRNGQITEEEAEHHPRRNVLLRALGTETEIKIDVTTLQTEEDQLVLLCSDGLTNKLSSDDLKGHLEKQVPIHEKAKELIHLANERGGEDNITVAIVQYRGFE
ncbi:Stp1/IreP family PP2C-type Ser/Thr phosphatase [Halalkalibacter akibai]|uniref:protein-serine/threonine phosphatase n=1 Tax=Halalkalibacter akibai (strain ATCC 43226 / DSM 21942 / CIP 109018 / JCM 9157 / 1139) TaxID=1236973 RepID=W4QQI6_HALA3|nr:Stp1/IreP family PP2C-type Ser/Thr phosphatase [Halalkalibacter akibai]GAE33903.1 protein serine/threonine phosphatase PrpC [Halalkalibacter akibai JCM 9157]